MGGLEGYWLSTFCDVQARDAEGAATRVEQGFVPPAQKIKDKTTFSRKEAAESQLGWKWGWEREEGHSCWIVRFVKKKGFEVLILFSQNRMAYRCSRIGDGVFV